MVTFQSRFGPEEWLQPYTDKTVEKLAQEGVKRIAVINPGFVSDCLETLEEIAGEAGESFHHNGGEKFTHIPCLNDSPTRAWPCWRASCAREARRLDLSGRPRNAAPSLIGEYRQASAKCAGTCRQRIA